MAANESSIGSSIADLAMLGKIVEQHRPVLIEMLRRRIDRRLSVRLDPEDVFQDAAIEARRRWAEFRSRPGGDVYVWLYSIVRDELLRKWRDHNRQRRALDREERIPDASAEQLGVGLFGRGPGPRTQAERCELRERLGKLIELLSDRDYEVVRARLFEGLSFEQVGGLLGIGKDAAAQRYCRALKRLRGMWGAVYGDDPSL